MVTTRGLPLPDSDSDAGPWGSTSLSGPIFYAYLQDPTRFLPTALSTSDEVNALLVCILDVDGGGGSP